MLTFDQKRGITILLLAIGFIFTILPTIIVFPLYYYDLDKANATLFNHPVIAISMVSGAISIFLGIFSFILTAPRVKKMKKTAKLSFAGRVTL